MKVIVQISRLRSAFATHFADSWMLGAVNKSARSRFWVWTQFLLSEDSFGDDELRPLSEPPVPVIGKTLRARRTPELASYETITTVEGDTPQPAGLVSSSGTTLLLVVSSASLRNLLTRLICLSRSACSCALYLTLLRAVRLLVGE